MISIIIPTYNEEKTIRKLLDTFSYRNAPEVIVADGASSDRTVELAQSYPVKLIQCTFMPSCHYASMGTGGHKHPKGHRRAQAPEGAQASEGAQEGTGTLKGTGIQVGTGTLKGTGRKNRAIQMNEGAKVSRGDILVFLHADSILEKEALELIECRLSDGYAGGCLSQKIESGNRIYRFIETSGNIRAKLFKIFYGDQAIFVRRDVFFQIGGFDEVELFDDLLFSRKLNRKGKTCVLNKKVYASPRRWEKQGVVKTTLTNWILTAGFLFGISPRVLKKIYLDVR